MRAFVTKVAAVCLLGGVFCAGAAAQTPTVAVSTTSIDFGNQVQGTASAPWTVSLSNTSGTPLAISSVSVNDPGDFALTGNCGSTLGAYSTCTMQVAFTPTTTGTLAGYLTFTDNAAGGSQSVNLIGVGTSNVPVVVFAPTSIDFGNQAVGTTSNSWTVTLNNTSGTDATLSSPIAITGSAAFVQTNTCWTTLAAHSSCNVVVSFAPIAPGQVSGQIVASIAGTTPLTVSLTGMGIAATPVVVFSPTSVDFGSQTMGTASNSWTVTLNNTSDYLAPFVTPILISGSTDFSQTNTCGNSLAPHSTCNVVVTFTPSSVAVITGQVSVGINGISTPLTVSLTGTGTSSTPVVQFSPTAIDFGSLAVGTTSNSWTVTLSNMSATAAVFTSPLAITGSTAFTETDNCGTSLAAFSTCNIQVSFTPAAPGVVTGQLVALVNGVTTPLAVSLTGTGTTSTPVVTFSPSSIDFGSLQMGTTSNPWTVTLSNTSGVAVTFASPIAISGDPSFTETNTCGTSLAAYSTCNVLVTFAPTLPGSFLGQLVVLINGNSVPQTVSLTGTGATPPSPLQFSSTSINMGNVQVGSTNNWTVTLSNTGGTTVGFSALQLAGAFMTQTNNCGTSLAAYSSCNIVIAFAPTFQGPITNQLILIPNSPYILPQILNISGTGVGAPLSLSPSSIDFGNQPVGSTSNAWTITMSNTTNATITFTPIFAIAPYFTETDNCGTSLAAYSSCNIQVKFSPIVPGLISLQMSVIPTSTSYLPVNVTLTGTGVGSALSISATSVDFGNQAVGTSSNPWTLTMSNTGSTAVPFLLELPGPIYTETDNCGTSLAAFSSCNILVTFSPQFVGPSPSQLFVFSTGLASTPVTVNLTGTGVPITSAVYFSTSNINFGTQAVGAASNAWTVTLNNTSGSSVPFSGLLLTDPGDFSQTNTCGSTSLPAYSTCTIQVIFDPATSGPISGALEAVIGFGGAPETLTLTGTGAPQPDYSLTVNPPTMTLNAGQTGLATFTFTPVGGYTGTVVFTCTGLPVGASCVFQPPTVTADGSNTVQTSQLTITTVGPSGGTVTLARNFTGVGPMLAAVFILPGMLCGLLGLRRKSLRGSMKQWALLTMLMAVMGGAVGCSSFVNATPPGKSVVTVTGAAKAAGTGTTSGATKTHTATFTLTIVD